MRYALAALASLTLLMTQTLVAEQQLTIGLLEQEGVQVNFTAVDPMRIPFTANAQCQHEGKMMPCMRWAVSVKHPKLDAAEKLTCKGKKTQYPDGDNKRSLFTPHAVSYLFESRILPERGYSMLIMQTTRKPSDRGETLIEMQCSSEHIQAFDFRARILFDSPSL